MQVSSRSEAARRIPGPQRLRRILAVALTVTTGALAISACGGSSGSSGTTSAASSGPAKVSDALTVAVSTPPVSLDPAKNGNYVEAEWMMDLAYDPLVKLQPDGRLGPGLASSWRYLNKQLTAFELTLRPDAKFSDGSPVTAQQVVASIQHEKDANGPVAIYVNTIKTAKATGPRTVRLDLVKANPMIAFYLTQRFLIADIVGPKGTQNPKLLGTATQGAGPYMLDKAATVTGDHYTFVPNPYYYDKSAIHARRFVVRVIRNPQTALSAVQSGQVDMVYGSMPLASAAKSAGLQVTSALAKWLGAFLFDRNGEVAKPLANPLVRQALNYALDRKGMSQAIFGTYAEANAQPLVKGYENQGWVDAYQDRYPYDPAKAKRLLAQAGYPNGFTIDLAATDLVGWDKPLAEAVANDWGKVGVKANIDGPYTDVPAFIAKWQAKKFPTMVGDYGGQPMYLFAQQALEKDAGLYNPWASEDPQLTALMKKAYAATTPQAQGAAWEAVTRRVVDLAWFAPVASASEVYFSRKDLQGMGVSTVAYTQDLTRIHY